AGVQSKRGELVGKKVRRVNSSAPSSSPSSSPSSPSPAAVKPKSQPFFYSLQTVR
ncbi:unnamed protein product, partial [Ceratitis capitata]